MNKPNVEHPTSNAELRMGISQLVRSGFIQRKILFRNFLRETLVRISVAVAVSIAVAVGAADMVFFDGGQLNPELAAVDAV